MDRGRPADLDRRRVNPRNRSGPPGSQPDLHANRDTADGTAAGRRSAPDLGIPEAPPAVLAMRERRKAAARQINPAITLAYGSDHASGRFVHDGCDECDEHNAAANGSSRPTQVAPQPIPDCEPADEPPVIDRTDETVATAPNQRDAWEPPEPLGRSSGRLPGFPVNVLPEPFAGMVTAVAEFSQTDAGMAGTSVLGMLAACCGGRAVVEARPGWREPCNLFTATVARPGERKSAVQAVLSAPLMDAERDLVDKLAPLIMEARTLREIEEKSANKAIMSASGPSSTDDMRADAISAAMRAEAIVVPTVPRILADDVTPEAAASLLAEQHGRLAIISAEGGIFDIIAGRYSNNVPNLDVWLKGHAGDRLKIDRKGRPAEYVERPALTVGVMIQDAVLAAIARNPLMRGRGLLARFLYCLPTSRVGYRLSNPPVVPNSTSAAYAKTVHDLAVTLAEWTDPVVLTLDSRAAAVLRHFQDALEPRLRPGSDLHHIADWANKAPGAAVRIAGLLHLAADPDSWRNTTISEATMAGAVTLAEFFTEHALAAFDAMNADPVVADAATIVDSLIGRDVSRFTVRDLHRTIVRSRFASAADAGPAIALLVQLGWIRHEPDPGKPGPGRKPSPAYRLYPAARNARMRVIPLTCEDTERAQ